MNWTARAVVVVVAAAGLVPVAGVAAAYQTCTVTWSGPARGAWDRAASWTPRRVPGAHDVACLDVASAPAVTVGSTTVVAGLRIGSGRVAVVADTTLTVTDQLELSGGGGLAGPGSVDVGGQARGSCECASFSDGVVLAAGIHLHVGAWGVFGRLTFRGGSTVEAMSTHLAPDSWLADGDGDPGNRFSQVDVGPGTPLMTAEDGSRIDVMSSLSGVVDAGGRGRVDFARLTNLTPDGTLTGVSMRSDGAVIGVPGAITALRDADLFNPASFVVSSTGDNATASLHQVVDSTVYAGTSTTTSAPLNLVRSTFVSLATLSAPSVVTGSDGHVAVSGVLDLADGSGGVDIRGSGSSLAFRTGGFSAVGGVVRGSVVVEAGLLDVALGRITRSLTMTDAAATTVSVGAHGRDLITRLRVAHRAVVAGTLAVTFSSRTQRPAVGSTVRLIDAAGGLSGTFASFQCEPGYQLSYDATGVILTRVF